MNPVELSLVVGAVGSWELVTSMQRSLWIQVVGTVLGGTLIVAACLLAHGGLGTSDYVWAGILCVTTLGHEIWCRQLRKEQSCE